MTLLHEHKNECDPTVWQGVEREHEVEHKCEGEGEGLFDLCYWQVRTYKLTG